MLPVHPYVGNRKKSKHARGNNAWWDAGMAIRAEWVVEVGLAIIEVVAQ
ncbi:hypothetical protein ABZ946_34835 [Streptomyces sp. NPDC046324]